MRSPSVDRALFSSTGSLMENWVIMLGIGSSWGGGDGGRGMEAAWEGSWTSMAGPAASWGSSRSS